MLQDSFLKNERHYLHQESKEFIEEYPQLSHFLSEPNVDPDINRTLDAFTYLTALLNAKLGKEYSQLTSSLMNMLWPNYLQQTPSITILEFDNHSDKTTTVSAGSTVFSHKVNHSDTHCTFTVSRDTPVSPFTIHRVEQLDDESISIHFRTNQPINLTHDELDNLRVYCGLDNHAGFLLYLWLSEYLSQSALLIGENEFTLRDLSFQPVGFKDDDSILVYPGNTFNGYRLLHEYFCYPEGFLFFDIKGIPDYFTQITTTEFALKLTFDRPLPDSIKIHNDLIKNNCAPAINLFSYDCEPILLNGQKTEYPLSINYRQKAYYELFAIEQVTGWVNQHNRHYALFDSFHHQIEQNKGRVPLYYHVNRRQSIYTDEIHYSVSFIRGDETEIYDQDEVISIKALCSNNEIAQNLRIGSICFTDESIPEHIQAKNITYPSKVMRPTLDGSQQWTTISSLSLNYLSLLNKDSLSQILQNYNFTTLYSHRAEKMLAKLLQGITHFDSKATQHPYQDLVVGGHESTIHISPTAFNNEGEMYLFGAVIAHFYSQYAAVNSFHFLNLINSSTNEVYQWKLMNI